MTDSASRIQQLLHSVDACSAEELLPLVYDELRSLARARVSREPGGQTLQATALVHEAFLRLGCPSDPKWDGRRHFFAAAAEAMRRILIDRARWRGQLKRGGGREREDRELDELVIEAPGVDVLAIDEALRQLEASDPRAREIVNLRCFVGMTITETATALGVSSATVEREWRFLRTFLQHALAEGEET